MGCMESLHEVHGGPLCTIYTSGVWSIYRGITILKDSLHARRGFGQDVCGVGEFNLSMQIYENIP